MKNDKYFYAGFVLLMLFDIIFEKIHRDYSIKVFLLLLIPALLNGYIEDKAIKQILRYTITVLLIIQFILNVQFDYYKI